MPPDVIVAGHLCLDIIPVFRHSDSLRPGCLLEVGPLVVSTGGAVSNTGLALHRLGMRTRLMGKVGRDIFGGAILDILRQRDPELVAGMIVDSSATTSYTVVISPPDADRMFLHHAGANDTFSASDIVPAQLDGARLLHFGYPTLMRSIHSDGGEQMERILRLARGKGLRISLDMSLPDPHGEASRVDWPAWLQRVLPLVDIFLPSLDETRLMLRSRAEPEALAAQLHSWGAGIVGLKLGAEGFYCLWNGRGYHVPCFQVDVVGTTGSGDSTIAGFLAAWLRGLPPEETMTMAVAVGACCCEAADAVSGVRSWEETRRRIADGWKRRQ